MNDNYAKSQAQSQLKTIVELVANLKNATTDNALETASEDIIDSALSVLVRGEWHIPGRQENNDNVEYEILLCTGGPAVRIIGDLDSGSPTSAELQYQDWGTPWTFYPCTLEEESALRMFTAQFYFGD